MTNTYALNVTKGQEFRTAEEIEALGLKPWVPLARRSRFVKEKGKGGEYVWYDAPYINKLIICVIPAIYFRDVVKLKHVIGQPLEFTRRDIEGDHRQGLKQFKAWVEAEYQDQKRKEANANYKCEFQPGDALRICGGPFADFTGPFQEIVRRSKDDYARVRIEIEIMGRATPVDVDPDQVQRELASSK